MQRRAQLIVRGKHLHKGWRCSRWHWPQVLRTVRNLFTVNNKIKTQLFCRGLVHARHATPIINQHLKSRMPICM